MNLNEAIAIIEEVIKEIDKHYSKENLIISVALRKILDIAKAHIHYQSKIMG